MAPLEVRLTSKAIGIIVVSTILWVFYLTGPPWDSPSGAAAIYSVLAFLTLILTVSVLNLQRIDDRPANAVLAGTTAAGFLILSGSTLANIVRAEGTAIHTRPEGVVLNLVALAYTGLMLVVYARHINTNYPEESSWWDSTKIVILVAGAGVAASVAATFAVMAGPPPEMIVLAGYVLGATSVLSYAFSAYDILRKRGEIGIVDGARLGIAAALMSGASAVHAILIQGPSSLWLLSMGLLAVAFVYTNIGVATPMLVEMGVSPFRAYMFSVMVQVVIVLPALGTYVINNYFPVTTYVNIPLSMILHLGGAFMAGAAVYFLYQRERRLLAHWHRPLALLFLFWSLAEATVAISPLLPGYNNEESVLPYLLGSVVTFLLLGATYRRTMAPGNVPTAKWTRATIASYVVAIVALLAAIEGLRLVVGTLVPPATQSALESLVMLAFALLSLYPLLWMFYSMQVFYGGQLSFDAILAAFNTVWIVVTILRANFAAWTIGWWSSEVLLYSTAMIAVLHLVRSYVQEVRRRERLEQMIALERSMTLPPLTETLAALGDLVEAMGAEKSDEARLEMSAKALSQLSRAQSILETSQIVVSDSVVPFESLETIDMVDLLKSIIRPQTHGCMLVFENDITEWPVKTRPLIADTINGILSLILRRIGRITNVTVAIEPVQPSDKEGTCCTVRLDIEVEATNAREKGEMLLRYATGLTQEATRFTQAKLLIPALHAKVDFGVHAESENRLLVTMTLALPMADESPSSE